jgi:molecular chaperone GrpE
MSRPRRKRAHEEDEHHVSDHAPHDVEGDSLSDERPPADVDAASSSADEEGGLVAVSEGPGTAEQELEALRAERDELAEQLLRRRADFENFRRRVERDRHTAAQEALAALFRELLGTVDNLERALSSSGGEDELRKGVELTYRELVGLLESHDVVPVDPMGERFDPAVQQALLHEPVPGLEEGEVAEVFRKGYLFGERLLRPALVKVAKGDAPGRGEREEGEDE